jgi:methyl-accepting chemotaxis protein
LLRLLGYAIQAPFVLGLAVFAAGALLILAGEHSLSGLLISLGLGMALGGGLTWIALNRTVSRPLARITETTETLSVQDSTALSDMLTAIAQGDLTNRLEPRARSVAIDAASSAQVRRLGEVVNTITARLAEGAAQLNSVTDEACRRLFYVGPDDYLQGQTCGDLMGRTIGGKGQVAVLSMNLNGVGLELRRKGFQGMLRERYPDVEVVEVAECPTDSVTVAQTANLLRRYPHLAGIYSTVGAGAAAQAVEDAGLAGRVAIVCHDLHDRTMSFVTRGVITATIGQDPYGQGHDSAIHLFNHLVAGWQPPEQRLLTAMDLVTSSNYGQYWQDGRGVVESAAAAARRPKPMGRSSRKLRIAIVGLEDDPFWYPLRDGALAAAEELKPLGAQVEWIVLPDKTFSLPVRIATIDSLVRQRYDAIATVIADTALVECVNRAVAAGVPVATFNCESSSLRGLMETLAQRAGRLLEVSGDLVASSASSGVETRQIAQTVSQMAVAAASEAEAVTRAHASIQLIAQSIEEMAEGARNQAQAAGTLTQAAEHIAHAVDAARSSSEAVVEATSRAQATAEHGSDSIRQALQQMESIQRAVESSAETIQETNAHAQKIGEIVSAIEDIAASTNLLALNAAIEAARAGEQGKGFAVVANEVRQLAEKSALSTREIGAIIATVQHSAKRASAAMDAAIEKVHDGSSLAQGSSQALDELLDSAVTTQRQAVEMVSANQALAGVVNDLNQAIESVSSVIEGNMERSESAAASIRETLETVESVAAISEENAVSADLVAVSTEEVSKQVQEVDEAAVALTGIARELEGATARFKLRRDEGDVGLGQVADRAEQPRAADVEKPSRGSRRTDAA